MTADAFDPARMRAERTARVLAGMAEEGIDALLAGTAPNIRYATGTTPLWLAGARAFAPLAILLGDGGIHLVAGSDDGVPPEVPVDHLLPTSWNPANLMASLASIGGLASARTVGVDALTPMFEGLLTSTFPNATLVDASPLLGKARATKTEDELFCMRTATAIAEAALAEVTADLVGRTERELHGGFVEHMASSGSTLPAFDGTFCVVGNGQPLRRFVSDRTVEPGDRVVLDVGVLFNGYEGGLAQTWVAGDGEVTATNDALDRVLEACRPGTALDDLAALVPDSAVPVAYGIGLGVEPLATETGSTLCAQVLVDDVLRRETVVLRPDGTERLSRDA